jgi:SAM-dependent methyltransferase
MKSDIPEFWHLGSYKYPFYLSQLQILLRSYIQKSFLILDAGCGPNGGYLTKTPINIQGIGLDISRTNIKNSIKTSKKIGRNKPLFVVGDIAKMPFHEDTFDVIICQDVLEHVKYKENAISEIAFSLKRGGKILISTTNTFNPSMFIDDILPKSVSERIIRVLGGDHHYERQRRLNPWNLRKKLIKHGIRVKKLLMTGYPPIGKPWIYQYSQIKPPKIFHLWIFFNELTDIHFFENFKEVMIVVAEKFCSSVERDRRA